MCPGDLEVVFMESLSRKCLKNDRARCNLARANGAPRERQAQVLAPDRREYLVSCHS